MLRYNCSDNTRASRKQKGFEMFDMGKVGQKIAQLRKSHNMTQLELADKIGISFQAVSNWERGNSMPDISKLPELASLFNVSIDELLGEKSELVERAVKGDIQEYLEHNDISPEEICKVAPILRPNQVDEIYESKKGHNMQEIVMLLPFLSEDLVDQLAANAVKEGKEHDLAILMPFVSEDTVSDIAHKMVAKGKSIAEIAPFVDDDDISEIADKLYQKSGIAGLVDILPFICEEQLEKIAEQAYAREGLLKFELIAPYLEEDYLNALAEKAIRKDGIKAISHIAPFLDREMLSEFVKEEYL